MKLQFRTFLAASALALLLAPTARVLGSDQNDRVTVGSDNHIPAGEVARHDAVVVMGNLVVDGEVAHDAVAVAGSNTVNGSAGHDVVAVLGNVSVNGPVGHNVVSVGGDVTLGPKAVVGHDVVSVGGIVHRDPAAFVGGNIVQPGSFGRFHLLRPASWWSNCLMSGRVLAFNADLKWLWIVHLAVLALYVLLALVFPRGVNRCGDLLTTRPGLVVLTGLLSIVALPVLFIVLLITVVGIPVAILGLPLAIVSLFLFGRAGILGLIGRRILGEETKPAVAVLVAGLLVLLLYSIPFVGLIVSLLVSALGFSCAATALLTSMQRQPATGKPVPPASAQPPPEASAPPAAPLAAEPPTVSEESASVPPAPAPAQTPPYLPPPLAAAAPPHVSAVGLPRAGFWIRTWALAIDVILVGLICNGWGHVTHLAGGVTVDSPEILPLTALYGALMWKLRATTVGGIIFGLKVVRLDDRPVDWATAIVRALGCFLSLIVFGLGFFWVAFDREKQSWHDKIAGTVVVRVPKGVPLV